MPIKHTYNQAPYLLADTGRDLPQITGTVLTLIMAAAVYGAHALLLPHGAHRVPRLRSAGRCRQSAISPPAEIHEGPFGG
jgi:hypothetical protein